MHNQQGSSLVVALVMLTIITLVAVYSIEGSTIQSKMVASSLFSSLTYQECRNEQESSIRFHNANNGVNRDKLLSNVDNTSTFISAGVGEGNSTFTTEYVIHPPKSTISSEWAYLRIDNSFRPGYELDTESQTVAHVFENTCTAQFRFSTNNQTLGVIVDGLVTANTEI